MCTAWLPAFEFSFKRRTGESKKKSGKICELCYNLLGYWWDFYFYQKSNPFRDGLKLDCFFQLLAGLRNRQYPSQQISKIPKQKWYIKIPVGCFLMTNNAENCTFFQAFFVAFLVSWLGLLSHPATFRAWRTLVASRLLVRKLRLLVRKKMCIISR